MALLNKIPKQDNRIVLLGDVINKGPRSYETYRYIRQHKMEQLLGNHEYYCIRREDPENKLAWYKLGGLDTVHSIRKNVVVKTDKQLQDLLDEMADWFMALPRYLLLPTSYGKKILATHAGISKKVFKQNNFSLTLSLTIDERIPGSFLFNKLDLADIPGCVQVIGHRPIEYKKNKVASNLMMDTGCVYNRNGMGWLSAVMMNLEQEEPYRFFHQINID
jgi:hypothetical protein